MPDTKIYAKIVGAAGRDFSDDYISKFIKGETGYELGYKNLTKPELGHIAKRIAFERELAKTDKRNRISNTKIENTFQQSRNGVETRENKFSSHPIGSQKQKITPNQALNLKISQEYNKLSGM